MKRDAPQMMDKLPVTSCQCSVNVIKLRIMSMESRSSSPEARPEINFRAIKQHPINRVFSPAKPDSSGAVL